MAIFGPKRWVNPFGKMSIFELFKLVVFIPQKGVFSSQNVIKDIFLAYIVQKEKVGKMAIFGPKAWVNPFGKGYIFLHFSNFLFLQPRKAFFILEYRKIHFPSLYCPKKKLDKWPFLDQNHGLTRLEKCQFLDFLNLLFLQPRKAFFRSRIS